MPYTNILIFRHNFCGTFHQDSVKINDIDLSTAYPQKTIKLSLATRLNTQYDVCKFEEGTICCVTEEMTTTIRKPLIYLVSE